MRAPPRNLSTYLCSLRVEAWEDTNTWTTATILAWYPQKIVVEHRLPPVLTWGWGTPGNNLCEIWFEILREKCRENFAKIFGDFTPISYAAKTLKLFHTKFPSVFPKISPRFPRRFRAWETERFPLTKAYPNQYSPDKGVVPQNLCPWQVTLPKKGWWMVFLFGFIRLMRSRQSALFDSKSRWKPASYIKSFFQPDPLFDVECFLVASKKHEHMQGFCRFLLHAVDCSLLVNLKTRNSLFKTRKIFHTTRLPEVCGDMSRAKQLFRNKTTLHWELRHSPRELSCLKTTFLTSHKIQNRNKGDQQAQTTKRKGSGQVSTNNPTNVQIAEVLPTA